MSTPVEYLSDIEPSLPDGVPNTPENRHVVINDWNEICKPTSAKENAKDPSYDPDIDDDFETNDELWENKKSRKKTKKKQFKGGR